MNFNNKVVVITGAGSGIGKAIALKFSKLSTTLSLIDMNIASLEETSELCKKAPGVKVIKHIIDVRKDDQVQKAVADTVAKFDRIDVVVNCAGIYNASSVLSPNTMKVFDDVMAVNLRAVINLTTLTAPELIKTKGCVVNISSIAAEMSTEDGFAYFISKSGVSHFTRCAALELAPYGVRVNAVLPGVVDTNIFKSFGLTQEQHEAAIERFTQETPLKRLVKADEIADMVLLLASDTAKSITGTNISVDGGSSILGFIEINKDNKS